MWIILFFFCPRILHEHAPFVIVINKIDYDVQSPSFKLHCSSENNGSLATVDACIVQWARDDLSLRTGDK